MAAVVEMLVLVDSLYFRAAAGVRHPERVAAVGDWSDASRAADLVRLVLRESLTAVAIGIGVAADAAQLTRAFAFGIAPLDPRLHVAGAVVLVITAALASVLPAAAATRADSLSALRAQ